MLTFTQLTNQKLSGKGYRRKNELEKQYKVLEEEYVASIIEDTESEYKASNTAKAWKVVNTISDRVNMPSCKLKGKSPEERKKQWLTHFLNLLGTPDKNQPIENIPLTFKNNIIIEDGVLISGLRSSQIDQK